MPLREVKRREIRQPVQADVRLTDATDGSSYAELTLVDMSLNGIGIDGLIHFQPDTAVTVDFPDGTRRLGRTRWRDAFTSGVAFDQPLTRADFAMLEASLCERPYFSAGTR